MPGTTDFNPYIPGDEMRVDEFDIEHYIRGLIAPMLETPIHDVAMEVSHSAGGETTTIEVMLGGKDYGRVIGKDGRTFKAITTILGTVEWRRKEHCTRYVLRVVPKDERR